MTFMQPAEFDVYIAPDGAEYTFDNGADKLLMSFTGYGMPGIAYLRQSGPFQHGETLLDYRLQPRMVQLEHRRQACDRQGYWENRADVLNYLRPNRQAPKSFALGKLRKILPDGSKRDLDVLIQQGPVFAAQTAESGEWLGFTEVVQFVAPDPTFYDPTLHWTVWTLESFGGLIFYESPDWTDYLTFDDAGILFGTDAVTAAANITYAGTWLSYPTIYIDGPLSTPTITNTTTGEKIVMAYDVAAGELVTITLPYGNKAVKNNASTNLIGTITDDSDLATFHIAPDPEAAGGVNVLSVQGNGGVLGQTAVRLSYQTRFIGI